MEKRNVLFSILDLTMILSCLQWNDERTTAHFYGSDEGAEVSLATRFTHEDNLAPDSNKLTSMRHEAIYNSFMRNVLSQPPIIPVPQRSQQNQPTIITPGREVIAMVVNAPVMTLTPGFSNFSHRIDPLHEEFNLFEAFQPSRMTEEAIRNLLVSSENANDSDAESPPSSSTISEITDDNDAILPILDTSDFRPQDDEERSRIIDTFLSEYQIPETTPMETHSNASPNFHSSRLSRGELFPSLDSAVMSTIDEAEPLPPSACARPSYVLDHDYCAVGRYSVRAREKITTRVIAAPPRRLRTNIEEDEGLGAVANRPVRHERPSTRNGERRITVGSDSGVEDDFETVRIQPTNCRNNVLYKVSIAQELVCAKQ